MPNIILTRDINERVVYDSRLSWAAKGLMIRLLNDEQSLGETYFDDNDWNQHIRDLLIELERNDYIRYTDKGEEKFVIYLL